MPSLFPSLRGRARGEAFNKMNRDTALVVFSGGQDSTFRNELRTASGFCAL